jgi:hypothetical protein
MDEEDERRRDRAGREGGGSEERKRRREEERKEERNRKTKARADDIDGDEQTARDDPPLKTTRRLPIKNQTEIRSDLSEQSVRIRRVVLSSNERRNRLSLSRSGRCSSVGRRITRSSSQR